MEKFIVLDVESCPIDASIEEVRADNQFVYDIGWIVTDINGRIYDSQSFVCADIFLNKELMKNAFFADKIPQYWEEIKSGQRTLTSFRRIRNEFFKDCKLNEVYRVFAYNTYFDYTALNRTIRYLTKSQYRYFFPYGIEICDIMRGTRKTLLKNEDYRQFCCDNDYLTKTNQPQLKAEIVYRFITNNFTFEEEHTGLADCKIEALILAYCIQFGERLDYNLFKPRETKFI